MEIKIEAGKRVEKELDKLFHKLVADFESGAREIVTVARKNHELAKEDIVVLLARKVVRIAIMEDSMRPEVAGSEEHAPTYYNIGEEGTLLNLCL